MTSQSSEFTLTLYTLCCAAMGACQKDFVMFERTFENACAALCLTVKACVGVQMLLQKGNSVLLKC